MLVTLDTLMVSLSNPELTLRYPSLTSATSGR